MMNENFFGKYSVFCVFGSVVGCVVVPLIAQVLQHQSMECMILSAIFLTLTAAHLKKGGSDSHHNKLLISRDYERKKYAAHSSNSNKKQKSNNSQNNNHSNHQKQQQQQHQNNQQNNHSHEQEYIQQYEHLKILEMEKRNEEKRVKKQKKREERLKRKEEECKKIKEEEERRSAKEKRKKQKDIIVNSSHHPYHQAITNKFEKYCCGDTPRHSSQHIRRPRTYSQDGSMSISSTTTSHQQQQQAYNKQAYITKRQNIPRFNNAARKNNHAILSTSYDGLYVRSNSDSLSINCSSSLSASCSSLSSIGSSGSCSPPPPPTSPKLVGGGGGASVWKAPYLYSDSESTKSLSPHKYDSNNGTATCIVRKQEQQKKSWTLNGYIAEEPTTVARQQQQHHQQQQRVLKSYTNVRPVRNKFPSYDFNSSSLFCSSTEEGCTTKQQVEVGSNDTHKGEEYSLFGSHQFGSSFI